MIELNSETDFVARNEQFQALAKSVAEAALKTDGKVESVLKAPLSGGKTVEAAITDAVATIGENMTLRRSAVLSVEGGVVASYVHAAMAPGLGKIGVLVGPEIGRRQGEAPALGRQIAMHVAAASPLAVDAEPHRPGDARARARHLRRAGAGIRQARDDHREDGRRAAAQVLRGIDASEAGLRHRQRAHRRDGAEGCGEGSSAARSSVTDFVVFRLGEGIQREAEDGLSSLPRSGEREEIHGAPT